MKKTLIITASAIIVILLLFLGWRLMFPGSSSEVIESVRDGLPFGSDQGLNVPQGPEIGTGAEALIDSGVPQTKLFRLVSDPIAGSVILTRGSTTVARYADRATGHIYDVDLATRRRTKITNQTIPKVYEAYFRPDGDAVLYRSLDEYDFGKNLVLTLTPPTATSTGALYRVATRNLGTDIGEVTVSGNTLYYTLEDSGTVISSNFDGSSLRTLFTSQFTDWRLYPITSGLIMSTKAAAIAPGYAYRVGNNTLTKILEPLTGLVILPNTSGTRFAYSYVEGGRTRFATTNYELASPTIADKCVWSKRSEDTLFCGIPKGNVGSDEPDNWYKGITQFSDRIWEFDTAVDINEMHVDPQELFGIDIDVYLPQLSTNEDYLVFQNKRDLSLWALKLD